MELNGTLEVAVIDGNATFSDLEISEPVTNGHLSVDCQNPLDYLAIALSEPFNVHPYPKTGTLKDITADFTYSGSIYEVYSVLDALALSSNTESGYAPIDRRVNKGDQVRQTYRITPEDISFWPDFDD